MHEVLSPIPQLLYDRDRRAPPIREGVLDMGRYDRVDRTGDEAVRLKFTQLLREHLCRDALDVRLEFTVPPRTLLEPPQDGHLPFSANHGECELNGIVVLDVLVEK